MKQHLLSIMIFTLFFTLFIETMCQPIKGILRYRDFNVIIDVKHGLLHNDYKFILNNGPSIYDPDKNEYSKLNEDILYYISYKYNHDKYDSSKILRTPIDTIKVKLNYKQSDKIFHLTQNLLLIKDDHNYSQNLVPYVPDINDGYYAEIIFDLGYSDDTYIRHLRNANIDKYTNKKYLVLYNYLKKMLGLK